MAFTVDIESVTRVGQFAVVKHSYKGKSGEKKLPLFGPNKGVAEDALNWRSGDRVSVTTAKNDKSGFVDWISGVAEDSGGNRSGGTGLGPQAAGMASNAGRGTSTYPTAEERSLQQVMIVRQSCLSNAAKILDSRKEPYGSEELISVAKELAAWVLQVNLDAE